MARGLMRQPGAGRRFSGFIAPAVMLRELIEDNKTPAAAVQQMEGAKAQRE